MSATDLEALKGFRLCCETEGLIIALETAHAVWATFELAKTLPKDQDIVMVRSLFSSLMSFSLGTDIFALHSSTPSVSLRSR